MAFSSGFVIQFVIKRTKTLYSGTKLLCLNASLYQPIKAYARAQHTNIKIFSNISMFKLLINHTLRILAKKRKSL